MFWRPGRETDERERRKKGGAWARRQTITKSDLLAKESERESGSHTIRERAKVL